MKKGNTIRFGVIGVGHLGNFHVKQLKQISGISISGIYDKNKLRADEISNQYDVKSFSSLKKLLVISDAVSIVTPTSYHFEIANLALENGCHLFIEKPITDNLEHAGLLLNKAEKLNKTIQVGHIERFNSAFTVLKSLHVQPLFIEAHRLAKFNSRGNDVPVILDLMIHDLDIILSLVDSEIKDIRANGVKVVSSAIDIANARIEFKNGCIANVTASRISQKIMRKMRLFQNEEYITIDFNNGVIEEYKICENPPKTNENEKVVELGGGETKYVLYRKPLVPKQDALKEELAHFTNSITNAQKPETDGESAAKALALALEIQKIIGN